MILTGTIPRHGVVLLRLTVVPTLSATDRVVWIAAREWPIVGALVSLGALVAFAPRIGSATLDPMLILGYLTGLLVTRRAARAIRASLVRLEVAVRR